MYSVYQSLSFFINFIYSVTCDISSVVPHTSFFPSQSLPLQPNLTFSTQEFSNHYLFWPRAPIWTLLTHSSPVHTRYSNRCKTSPNTYLLRDNIESFSIPLSMCQWIECLVWTYCNLDNARGEEYIYHFKNLFKDPTYRLIWVLAVAPQYLE